MYLVEDLSAEIAILLQVLPFAVYVETQHCNWEGGFHHPKEALLAVSGCYHLAKNHIVQLFSAEFASRGCGWVSDHLS